MLSLLVSRELSKKSQRSCSAAAGKLLVDLHVTLSLYPDKKGGSACSHLPKKVAGAQVHTPPEAVQK